MAGKFQGYVNEIPKVDKKLDDGEERTEFSDDVAGMGDATGCKDVGSEIDESGQVLRDGF